MCIGVQQNDNTRLKIKSFYLRLNVHNTRKPLPDSVTLCYLPRINGTPLEINGTWIRPDSPGFVTLHRVVSGRSVMFGSRERVRVSEGTRYEVYVGEDKLVKGIFRKGYLEKDDEYNDEAWSWKMDVKCVVEREIGVREAEVCVEGEAGVMREGVRVAVRKERRHGMEEIPEQREVEMEGCCCCCEEEEEEEDVGSDGGDEVVDVEGMRWAVDVGIWVVCLGVGYLVSKASIRKKLGRNIIS